MNSKRSHEGYLYVDHRNSPGLPENVAIRVGYDPKLVREGQVYEAPTLGCAHCGAHVVMNPWRKRDRGWCSSCDRYICDACDLARKLGWEHHSIEQLADLLNTGRWTLSGNMSRPILTQTENRDG